MRNNVSYNNIKIDSGAINKSKFNFSHDVNTSATFGLCQPIVSKLIVPNSKTSMSVDPIIRMAAMVSPTVGRLKYKTWSAFVGCSDLLRSFSAFLTKKTYSTTVGVRQQVELPSVIWRHLSALVLIGCRFSLYVRSGVDFSQVDKTFRPATASEAQGLQQLLVNNGNAFSGWTDANRFPNYYGNALNLTAFKANLQSLAIPVVNSFSSSGADWLPSYKSDDGQSFLDGVTLTGADYVFERNYNGTDYAFAVRLSSFGAQLRKVLLGLGYQINFFSGKYVNMLPLFAYYKAWFDSFGLTLYQNYESTNAAFILNSYDNGIVSYISPTNEKFIRFIYDLVNTWVTDPQDFISAHQRADTISSPFDGFVNNIVCIDPNNGPSETVPTTENEQTTVFVGSKHAYINKVEHTQVDAELLKRLYKFTNRNTIAGRRIAELLRAGGYGKYVDEQKSTFIAQTETELEIGTVTATSDGTNSVTGNNSVLGEYAGFGFGHDKKTSEVKHVFENDEFGYWITFAAIVPENGYCQGIDLNLFDIYPEQMYQSEFDGLGFELSPKAVLKASTDWVPQSPNDTMFDDSFGEVPRFSRYKVSNNVLNGDFSLRSKRAALLPFVFDKFIDSDDDVVTHIDNSANEYTHSAGTTANLPLAGNAYRFNTRYPWLSSLQRIFAHFDQGSLMFAPAGFDVEIPTKLANYEYLYLIDDNFYIFNQIQMFCQAPMLPISESYGTLDDDGRSDMSIAKA